MQSVVWILSIIGVTTIVATPLPFPQSTSSDGKPQPSDGVGVIGLRSKEVLKDLTLLTTGALGAKFFYGTRSRKPPNNSRSNPAKPPAADERPRQSGAIGFDLDKIPFHKGDEFGQGIRKTMTADELTMWEKCVERYGGKRSGTGMSAPDLDVFAHCHNEIRLARRLARIKAERDAWARAREMDITPLQQEDHKDFSILAPVQAAVNKIGNAVREATVPTSPMPLKGFNGGGSFPVAPISYVP